MNVLCYLRHFVKTSCGCYESCTVPLRCARFTLPSVKYLILDNFHFRINPQIINYNGLSFHTSMGLPELGRAVARWPPGRRPFH
jgi:hypothetical protein